MSLLVSHRIVRIRVSVISFGQQYRGSQIHGLSPKGGEELALDLHVTDVFGVRLHLDGTDFVVQRELDLIPAQRIQMESTNSTVEIPGRLIELLSLPLI